MPEKSWAALSRDGRVWRVAGVGWAGGVAQRAVGELHGGEGGGAQQVVQHQAHQGREGRPASQGEQVTGPYNNI